MTGDLTREEFHTLIRLAKKVLWAGPELRRKIQQHNVNIVPANFYSDIPLIDDIYNSFEYRGEDSKLSEVYNSSIFHRNRIDQFIEQISVYANEFNPPIDGNREHPDCFFWNNPAFSYSDAMSYYCVVRHFKPVHILEIGAGFSTLVADQALRENGNGKLTLIEPYPKNFLKELGTVDIVIESFVQDIPVTELVQLAETSDLLFIDSTHTVKVGSDCLYIYLKLIPEIKKDLVVHSHDIFLPFGFPKQMALQRQIYWTEQYLLYAYMLDNPKIEVLFGSAYAVKRLPKSLGRLMGDKYPAGGGSIWYKLNGCTAGSG